MAYAHVGIVEACMTTITTGWDSVLHVSFAYRSDHYYLMSLGAGADGLRPTGHFGGFRLGGAVDSGIWIDGRVCTVPLSAHGGASRNMPRMDA